MAVPTIDGQLNAGEMEDVANALRSIRVLRVFGKLNMVEGVVFETGACVFHRESSVAYHGI